MLRPPSLARRTQRPGEELGQVGRLLVALDRREDQLDRPLGRQALGLERIGEAQAADDEVGRGGAAAVELALDILAFGQQRCRRAAGRVPAARMLTVQIGRADLDELHRRARARGSAPAALRAANRGRRRRACRRSWSRWRASARARPLAAGRRRRLEALGIDVPGIGSGVQPCVVPSTPSGKGAGMRDRARAARARARCRRGTAARAGSGCSARRPAGRRRGAAAGSGPAIRRAACEQATRTGPRRRRPARRPRGVRAAHPPLRRAVPARARRGRRPRPA